MEIGNKILDLRKEHNLSQEQLAEKMHVARQTISKWELGETSPDLKEAKKLAQIFNVSLDELACNDIKSILITKVSNTEKLAMITINILKGIGIMLIILVVGLLSIFLIHKYFEVKVLPVADRHILYCNVNGTNHYYEATIYGDNPGVIELTSSDDVTIKAMKIDTSKYKNQEKLINDIKKYITKHGGECNSKYSFNINE